MTLLGKKVPDNRLSPTFSEFDPVRKLSRELFPALVFPINKVRVVSLS
jgi:hypothetical protein